MSIGGTKGSSSQTSRSKARSMIQQDIRPLRAMLGQEFMNQLAGGLVPQGVQGSNIISSQFANLFGDDPSSDFLGARNAIMQGLGGGALQNNISQAFQAMQPALMDSMRTSNMATNNQAGPLGLRFGTDAMNLAGKRRNELTNQAMDRAVGTGVQMSGQQLQGGLNLLNQIGQLSQGGLGSLLPLIVGYGTSYAPVGQDTKSTGSSKQVGFNLGL